MDWNGGKEGAVGLRAWVAVAPGEEVIFLGTDKQLA